MKINGLRFLILILVTLHYHRAKDLGTVRIAFNRPECRNAFRPQTVDELYRALDHARMTTDVGSVILTGNGRAPKMVAGHSAQEATNAFAEKTVTNTTTESRIIV